MSDYIESLREQAEERKQKAVNILAATTLNKRERAEFVDNIVAAAAFEMTITLQENLTENMRNAETVYTYKK